MTSEDLRRCYLRYNARYFGGKLDKNLEVIFTRLPIDTYGSSEHFEGEWQKIHINRVFGDHDKFIKMVLLHEMVHVSFIPPNFNHGPRFEAEMLRLAKAGAFRGLW